MKDELKKKKKLQDFAKAAGAGGIKNAVSDDTKKKIGQVAERFVEGARKSVETIGKAAAEAGKQTVGSMAEELLKRKKKKQLP